MKETTYMPKPKLAMKNGARPTNGSRHHRIGQLQGITHTFTESIAGEVMAAELEEIRTTINEAVDRAAPHLQPMGDALVGGDYERMKQSTPEEMEAMLAGMFKIR